MYMHATRRKTTSRKKRHQPYPGNKSWRSLAPASLLHLPLCVCMFNQCGFQIWLCLNDDWSCESLVDRLIFVCHRGYYICISGFPWWSFQAISCRCCGGCLEPRASEESWDMSRRKRECLRVPLTVQADWQHRVPLSSKGFCMLSSRESWWVDRRGSDAWRWSPVFTVWREGWDGIPPLGYDWPIWIKVPSLWTLIDFICTLYTFPVSCEVQWSTSLKNLVFCFLVYSVVTCNLDLGSIYYCVNFSVPDVANLTFCKVYVWNDLTIRIMFMLNMSLILRLLIRTKPSRLRVPLYTCGCFRMQHIEVYGISSM